MTSRNTPWVSFFYHSTRDVYFYTTVAFAVPRLGTCQPLLKITNLPQFFYNITKQKITRTEVGSDGRVGLLKRFKSKNL